MTLFKSKRRRRAERAGARVLELYDGSLERLDRGFERAQDKARRSARRAGNDARLLKAVAKKDALAVRRKTSRIGGHLSDMVHDHPGATIGAALALAVAIGAGATVWTRRS